MALEEAAGALLVPVLLPKVTRGIKSKRHWNEAKARLGNLIKVSEAGDIRKPVCPDTPTAPREDDDGYDTHAR